MPQDKTSAINPAPQPGLGREYLAIFIPAALLYFATTAPGVLWQDSGMLHIRVCLADYTGDLGLALSHPVYFLMARFWAALIHFGDYAWRINLFSALAAALTIANLYLIIRLFKFDRFPAILATLTLAFAHTFWFHAVLAEIYTLCTMFLSFEIICLTQYFNTNKKSYLYLMFFLNGLAVANHNLAGLALFCYALLALYLLFTKKLKLTSCFIILITWMIGALPFEYLIIREIINGSTIPVALHSAAFGEYQGSVLSTEIPFSRVMLYVLMNFPTPNLLLFFPGLIYLIRGRTTLNNRPLELTLLGLLAVYLIFAIRYKVPDQFAFFVPAYLMMVLTIALAAQKLIKPKPGNITLAIIFACLPILVYAIGPQVARARHIAVPGLTREVPFRDPYTYFLQPWKTRETGPQQFAQAVAQTVPPGSIIIADSTTMRPLLYNRIVYNQFPEIILLTQSGTPADCPSKPPMLTEQNIFEELSRTNIYIVTPQKGYAPQWLLDTCQFTPADPIYKISPKNP